MSEHVWQGFDFNVLVFYDDGDGNRLNSAMEPYNENTDYPLLDYCFWQTVNLDISHQVDRKAVTGRVNKKLVSMDNFTHTFSVEAMYFRRRSEVQDPFRNRENIFQIWLKAADPGRILNPEDTEKIKIAKITRISITGEENGIFKANLNIEAEEIEGFSMD